ncbi:bifunctional diaminohydroxyphosphoribosylaminopyrimidine deaminase/5-amino-6-(5-phosphoribosylamino)uracil reductase RibD [Rosenbergiella epipactidis]|uniref:bifunctional diaminohydroxyphosphoribosylaminopyrimidine deaminase/5-amino-6-(5-phosphoribosylamino)uracil reductase RibD n=1 Tax=Rosenbergiella epipactidis TaxID=1544694 RepID=UPI001BDAB58B|nr:bifunctional diaminohydroxyphosphoribosylaminopyrimidine deaminase/5-amino-6-(5-phosphoribosylamino)uracil reductase RibD [Rosenbergiella epipactidis]MBT0719028.1 bifunctional diaminohydroxyphosphoribosylaminopyrimidine deaminase/5-amino-6-(5-phosphoribosylamino)uracil reductase RibD [Rosenbergiella epipactidis]
MSDHVFMQQALDLAKRGRFTTSPNPNVGCVIVQDGEVVGQGWHKKAGEGHAEVNALREAGDKARGATAYVTLEPCSHHGRTPPCCDALIAAGISRVIVAMQDPNPQVAGRGLHRLRQAGIDVEFGLLAAEAEAINRGFLKRMRTGFPWVQLKMAASLDGRTAMANGESKWITSSAARQDVQAFRAEASAILTTSKTVLADNPSMNVRWSELSPAAQASIGGEELLRQPIRVVLDRHRQVNDEQTLFTVTEAQTWRVVTQPGEGSSCWAKTLVVPEHQENIDLVALMMVLGKQEINSVWVEAGASLAGQLLQAGVVDELILYMAPTLMGTDARGLCVLPGLEHLAQALRFEIQDIQQVGPDIRIILQPTSVSA